MKKRTLMKRSVFNIGDRVRIVDPESFLLDETGTVTLLDCGDGTFSGVWIELDNPFRFEGEDEEHAGIGVPHYELHLLKKEPARRSD